MLPESIRSLFSKREPGFTHSLHFYTKVFSFSVFFNLKTTTEPRRLQAFAVSRHRTLQRSLQDEVGFSGDQVDMLGNPQVLNRDYMKL